MIEIESSLSGRKTTSALSTREAAEILGVHASSVKRWCDDGALGCWRTAGGHRRIPLEALLAYAREERRACSLLAFAPFEERVWRGVEQIRNDESARDLVALTYGWLLDGRERLLSLLLSFLVEMNGPHGTIYDACLAPLLHHVGDQWEDGQLGIGDVCRMAQGVEAGLHYLRHGRVRPPDPVQPSDRETGQTGRTAVVGGLRGERHELGAQMVRLVLEAEGWQVVYLGGDVPTEEFAYQQAKHRAAVVGVSLLPPRGRPDAWALIETLAREYDLARPYRLALGGSGLRQAGVFRSPSLPFVEVKSFLHLEPFVRWITDIKK